MYSSLQSTTGGVTTGIHTRVNGIPKYPLGPLIYPSFSSLIVSLFLSSCIQLTYILIYTFSIILPLLLSMGKYQLSFIANSIVIVYEDSIHYGYFILTFQFSNSFFSGVYNLWWAESKAVPNDSHLLFLTLGNPPPLCYSLDTMTWSSDQQSY